MSQFPKDIYTEPAEIDPDTLKNLGPLAPGAKSFELTCEFSSLHYGTLSNPFLDHAFRTEEFRIKVTVNADGTWTYDEDTVLKIAGSDELFHHTDKNTMRRLAGPTPNPLMRAAG